ncbi:MAG: hypothetical protein LBT74_13690 [Acidobacteriota bacterium]|nr:hypothetical protein [Acidobacteriota bacterium]
MRKRFTVCLLLAVFTMAAAGVSDLAAQGPGFGQHGPSPYSPYGSYGPYSPPQPSHSPHPPASPYAWLESLADAVNSGQLSYEQALWYSGWMLEKVELSGLVGCFGVCNGMYGVPGTTVSIAEIPALSTVTGMDGRWALSLAKVKNLPRRISFLYENPGVASLGLPMFHTVKSNVFTVTNQDIGGIAIQFPSEEFFQAAKGIVAAHINLPEYFTRGGYISNLPGAYKKFDYFSESQPVYAIGNIVVATVGKSWATMMPEDYVKAPYEDAFPHGDPGAVVKITPEIEFPGLGPVYFNRDVLPDFLTPYISDDGGVMFANVPNGTIKLDAKKSPYKYTPVEFEVEEGVDLYIATPPYAIMGTNGSPAGDW